MKALSTLIILSFSINLTLSGQSSILNESKDELCFFIGGLALPAATTASFAVCSKGSPAACQFALIASDCLFNEACKSLVRTFTIKGCHYTIETLGDRILFKGQTSKNNSKSLEETTEWLNTIPGLEWISKQF